MLLVGLPLIASQLSGKLLSQLPEIEETAEHLKHDADIDRKKIEVGEQRFEKQTCVQSGVRPHAECTVTESGGLAA